MRQNAASTPGRSIVMRAHTHREAWPHRRRVSHRAERVAVVQPRGRRHVLLVLYSTSGPFDWQHHCVFGLGIPKNMIRGVHLGIL